MRKRVENTLSFLRLTDWKHLVNAVLFYLEASEIEKELEKQIIELKLYTIAADEICLRRSMKCNIMLCK